MWSPQCRSRNHESFCAENKYLTLLCACRHASAKGMHKEQNIHFAHHAYYTKPSLTSRFGLRKEGLKPRTGAPRTICDGCTRTRFLGVGPSTFDGCSALLAGTFRFTDVMGADVV